MNCESPGMTADSRHRGSIRMDGGPGMYGRKARARDAAICWLSEARLKTYLDPCDGDLHLAMCLS